MKESPKHSTKENSASERGSRIFLFLAGGLLLSILVSCACGPVR